ncbi:Hypothetical protein PSEBR_m1655 [Pseudomonas brassicacearum subsp. brassicacearum NFM421]|uniref:Uncharacterized protein n=1 Tax=Pseudomonas brassicacearum (strain NFM421) TaxID=994484 RepID=F2K614_PSEBN|nr:Hypothetical protein PSEBR_m1655 [Pseudomonas brassicacearum subsp. brassicacearum NFM421]
MWEQGLPAMKTPRPLEDRSAWIASKLCSHKARSHIQLCGKAERTPFCALPKS